VIQCHVTALAAPAATLAGAVPESVDKRLVAYLVRTAGASDNSRAESPSDEELRSHLASSLPDFMLPDSYIWLDELPLGPNGKIDRHALPAPTVVREVAEEDLPSPGLEQDIAEVVASLLGLSAVGAEEDFFLLGGHSLLAAQLIAVLSDSYGVEVELRAVFEGPTVRDLAAEVERLVVAQLAEMSDEEAEACLAQVADPA
jgi:acyl carrier protein